MEPRTPQRRRTHDVVSATPAQRLKPHAALNNYVLGDRIGKGASGTVYSALNQSTGKTVAIKQIALSGISNSDLETIMTEIDLLKNLNHPNIVKYHGFVKTNDTLSIILEYCENGSLHTIYRKFGRFPENLAAVYIGQVLQGLEYLHDQGAIHRDIKGANILTTKEGRVKLADFGVAARVNEASSAVDRSIVGTPNWMAPEVIEVNGSTTASDIWSLGCTVIELISGRAPYHDYNTMAAMYAIVKNDYPPLPERISADLKDFLLECFQKDPNLRISARKLRRHPWLMKSSDRDSKVKNYSDAVETVKLWNISSRPSRSRNPTSSFLSDWTNDGDLQTSILSNQVTLTSPPKNQRYNILDNGANNGDFSHAKPIAEVPKQTSIAGSAKRVEAYAESDGDEGFSDLEGDFDVNRFQRAVAEHLIQNMPGSIAEEVSQLSLAPETPPSAAVQVALPDIRKLAETEIGDDYSNDFDETSLDTFDALNSKHQTLHLSTSVNDAFSVEDSLDEQSPEIEHRDFDPRASAVSEAQAQTESLVTELNRGTSLDDGELVDITIGILRLLELYPECCKTITKLHGAVPIVEALTQTANRSITVNLIRILTLLVGTDTSALESFVRIGGLPTVMQYTTRKHLSETRRFASLLVETVCDSSVMGLDAFMICGGLTTLSDFLMEDYHTEQNIVFIGVRGIANILKRQDLASRNYVCRALCRVPFAESLAKVLTRLVQEKPLSTSHNADELISSIMEIFNMFAQASTDVKTAIARREVLRRLLRCYSHLNESHRLMVLKFIKNLSSHELNLKVIQDSNAISKIVKAMKSSKAGAHYREVANQALPIMFNLCRLNHERQSEAADAGLVPFLLDAAAYNGPIRDFALPMLCDMAHAGVTCRDALWRGDALSTFVDLTVDRSWQTNAYDAIAAWLKEEQARVEDKLSNPDVARKLVQGLELAGYTQYGAAVESFHSILKLSSRVCKSLPLDLLFSEIRRGIRATTAPTVVLNLLRALRMVLGALSGKPRNLQGLDDVLLKLSTSNKSILVRNLAREILSSSEMSH